MNDTIYNPFDNICAEYDQWFDENKNIFQSELEAVRNFLPKQGNGIEIGVGTGRYAMELGIGHGIEPSANMAEYSKQRGIEVKIAKAEKLPYDDESFDYAIMVTVDPFVDDIVKVYHEIFRVIKTGGKLIVGTLHKEGAVAQKYMGMTLIDAYKNAHFHTISETIEQLEISGFSGFNTCQTLFDMKQGEIEIPIPGHDKGSFVAVEAIKAN